MSEAATFSFEEAQDDAPEAEKPTGSGKSAPETFSFEQAQDPRRELPAGVKPAERGAGRGGPTAEELKSQRTPSLGLAAARGARDAVQKQRETTLAAAEPGSSVLDKPYVDPAATTDPETGLRRMSDAEYKANYSGNTAPPAPGKRETDTIKNTPRAAVAGGEIRRATGSGSLGAAAQGAMAGGADVLKAVPGLLAMGADLVGAKDFAQAELNLADGLEEFSTSVRGAGGDPINKLIGNVFSSTVQSLPTMVFGAAGAAEMVAGKVVADGAAKAAASNAMRALFVQTAGAEYADSRNRGFAPGESAARSAMMAAAEVLGERFGFHEQMAVLRATIGKKQLSSAELGRVLATEMVKEIPGEELTTALQFLTDKYGPAAKSPKATLADYLEQAGDTAVQTAAQVALMGAPASVVATYKRANAAMAYDKAAQAGLNVKPPYTTDTPDQQHAKTVGVFTAMAAQYGIDPTAVKRATEAAKGMPVEQVGPFLSKMTKALQKRQLVAKPVDAHATEVLEAGPMDDPKMVEKQALEAEKARQGQENAPATSSPEEDLTGLSEPSTADLVAQARTNLGAPSPVDEAAHAAAHSPKNDLPEPTQAQKEAGNYQKGHARIAGLDISIENPEGSTRSGTSPDGKTWSNQVQHHYGYIRGTVSADKEHIDTFIKPGTTTDHAGEVFVVDQNHPDGTFDESKVMIGFNSEAEAKAAYLANYQAGWKGLRSITPMTLPDFKAWAFDPARSVLPAAPGDSGDKAARGEKSGGNGRAADARPVGAPALQDLAKRQEQMPQPAQPGVSQLRGPGNQGGPADGRELPGVSGGRGRAPDAPAQSGTQGERGALRSGQSDLGDKARAGEQPAQEQKPDAGRSNANADRVGAGVQRGQNDTAQSPGARDDTGASPRIVLENGPQQPDVRASAGEPAVRGRVASDLAGRSGRDVGRVADGGERRAENAPAALVASSRTTEPVRNGSGSAAPVARAIALVGPMPNQAKPLELRPNKDGSAEVWHDGHAVLNFESGDPVQVPKGTSDVDALQIVKDSGAFGRRARYFAAPKADPSNSHQAEAPAPAVADPSDISGLPGVEPGDTPASFGPRGLKGNAWVLRDKATGNVQMETSDPAKVRALNTEKYEAVPVGQHLASLNKPADRRKNSAERKRVADMSPEELREALFTDDLTGLHNRRWMSEHEGEYSHVIAFDADSLKWINDNLSHQSGDMLLMAWGQALQLAANGTGTRVGGDEFFALANSAEEAAEITAEVQRILSDATVTAETPDGEVIMIRGVGVSFGVATTKKEADEKLNQHKAARAAAGERAGRGEQPPGVTRKPAQGKQDQVDQAAQVAEEAVTTRPPEVAAQIDLRKRISVLNRLLECVRS